MNQGGEPVPTVSYNITGGDAGPFYVNSSSGSVLVRAGETIDYDGGPDFYVFTVQCVDRANPNCNDMVHVNITILPVNEYLPELSEPTIIYVNVSETLEVGTTLISTEHPSLRVFSARDRDRGEHGRIRYSFSTLTRNSNSTILSFLRLNGSTGALVVDRSLDIDSKLPLTTADFALYVISITVCDREEDADSADKCPNLSVTIHVDSVNEFNPKFSQKVYSAAIPESEQVGIDIVEISCTDQDIGRGRFQGIRFTENDNRSRNFALEGNNIVRLMHPLDFEEIQLFNITLACHDNGNRNDTAQLIINVEAINEHKPQFTQDNYTFAVNRLSTVGEEIGQVEAIDRDLGNGGDVSYTLQGDSEKFGIRSNGMIFLDDYIFVTEDNFFVFEVVASDGQFNDTAQVHISLIGSLNVIETATLVTGIFVVCLLLISAVIIILYTLYRKRARK